MLKIKPGYLVHLSSRKSGGVKYERRDLEASRTETTAVSRWETVKTVSDVEEHKLAQELQNSVCWELRRICITTPIGRILVCPESRLTELLDALEKGKLAIEEWNKNARHTRLEVVLITARIAADDREAAGAVLAEARDLLASLERALETRSVEKIRKAAKEAAQIAPIMEDGQAAKNRLELAVKAARAACRRVVAAVKESGEAAAVAIEAEEFSKAVAPVAAARLAVRRLSAAPTAPQESEESEAA